MFVCRSNFSERALLTASAHSLASVASRTSRKTANTAGQQSVHSLLPGAMEEAGDEGRSSVSQDGSRASVLSEETLESEFDDRRKLTDFGKRCLIT